MNNRQIAKNNMYKKMLLFFANPLNAAVWAAFARLVAEIANFVSLNDDFDTATQAQAVDTKGITKGKSDAFQDMIKLTVSMAYKAYVWAVDEDNDNLIQVFNVQLDDFDGMAEQTALDKVKNIRDNINTNIAAMAGVNLLPADVTALDASIAAYEAVRSAPEVAIGNKETSTDAIAALMHPIDDSLDLIGRLIVSEYSTSNPTLVGDFKNNRHIDDLPTHHSGIHAHITDSVTGSDLEGALLAIPSLGKSATADINGIAEIIKVKTGTYHISVTFPGYHSQTFKTHIIRGKISSFNIKMATGTNGGGGVTAIREGDVPSPANVNIDVEGINGTPLSNIIILVTLSPLRFYVSNSPDGVPGPDTPFIDVQPGTPYQNTLDQFLLLLGFNQTNRYLMVQNIGMTTGHYQITFDNLEA